MVGESNQNVFLIQIDASNFAEFDLSEFEISRFNCICKLAKVSIYQYNRTILQVHTGLGSERLMSPFHSQQESGYNRLYGPGAIETRGARGLCPPIFWPSKTFH